MVSVASSPHARTGSRSRSNLDLARSVLCRGSMHDVVALVARDAATRSRLTGYLVDAGFVIEEFADTPPITGGSTWAVWVIDREEEAHTVAARIRPWLIARTTRRVVILTWRPRSVRDLLDHDHQRLELLVPPVFPWQIVDALRAAGDR